MKAGALLLTSALLGLLACSSSSESSTKNGTSKSPDVEIGMTVSLTGGLGTLGLGLRKAVQVAETQINQIGVLGGRRVRYYFVDDLSSPDHVVNVVNELLQRNPAGILGPNSSGLVTAVEQLTYNRKVVQISATATSTLLTTAQPQRDRYFFRTAPPDDFQGKAIARFIYDGVSTTPSTSSGAEGGAGGVATDGGAGGTGVTTSSPRVIGGGCKKASMVHADDPWGNALYDVVTKDFAARGGSYITVDKVPTILQSDYEPIARRIVAAQPDCVVFLVYSDVGAQFLRDLKAAIKADRSGHDFSKFFTCGADGSYDGAFIPAGQADPANPTSENSTEGAFGTFPDPAPDTPEYYAFRNLWQHSFPGTEPEAYTPNQYDAALILALAIQKAGTATDGAKIRDALYEVTATSSTRKAWGPAQFVEAASWIANGIPIKYRGASGPCTFDDFGNVKSDYIVWHVQKQSDGTFKFASVGKMRVDDLEKNP